MEPCKADKPFVSEEENNCKEEIQLIFQAVKR